MLNFGTPYRFGLEAGCKPELLAVIAIADNDTPIICNGFKDAEFIETAMLAQKMGRNIIPVVEKYTELDLILEVRARRSASGRRSACASSWRRAAAAAGSRSGGYPLEVRPHGRRDPARARRAEDARHGRLLQAAPLPSRQPDPQHPHRQAARSTKPRASTPSWRKAGAGLQYLDVGGGLGVDYDGSQTNFESSMNYTLEEYANDVVYHIQTVCDEAGVPHPTIVSESGRAVVAYHSVLVFNVLGVSGFGDDEVPTAANPELEQPLIDLRRDLQQRSRARNALESFHDAQQALDMALNLFTGGYLPLEQRSMADKRSALRRMLARSAGLADLNYVNGNSHAAQCAALIVALRPTSLSRSRKLTGISLFFPPWAGDGFTRLHIAPSGPGYRRFSVCSHN